MHVISLHEVSSRSAAVLELRKLSFPKPAVRSTAVHLPRHSYQSAAVESSNGCIMSLCVCVCVGGDFKVWLGHLQGGAGSFGCLACASQRRKLCRELEMLFPGSASALCGFNILGKDCPRSTETTDDQTAAVVTSQVCCPCGDGGSAASSCRVRQRHQKPKERRDGGYGNCGSMSIDMSHNVAGQVRLAGSNVELCKPHHYSAPSPRPRTGWKG